MLLVGTVFIYTPGDIFVSQILNEDISSLTSTVVTVYAVIFSYYLIAALFPIDKIIGRIYPIFGAILLLSAVGIFFGLFINGYHLTEIWETGISNVHPFGDHFIPMFFVTVACGIVSGFHSTQATLIARTVTDEWDGRLIYYNTMIAEGFIAMSWAAATMGAMNWSLTADALPHIPVDAVTVQKTATAVVGIIAKDMLGSIGGAVAIGGVIVLAVTSGDTALRSLRIMIGDALHIDQRKKKNSFTLAVIIFSIVAGVLYYAKTDASGFSILWRYFSWANETIAVFAFAMIAVYMMKNNMPYIMAIIPGSFYMYIVSSYILHAPIGLGLSWTVSYILAVFFTVAYAYGVIRYGRSGLK